MPHVKRPALYGITPDGIEHALILASAGVAFEHGMDLLQLRTKAIVGLARKQLAQDLLRLACQHGKQLIINDDAQLAKQIGAHGVHLGAADGDIAKARALLGDAAMIGASCYGDIDRARRAAAQGASYLAFGALFPSTTKPHAPRAELALFQQAADLSVPTVGIGGITLANAASVMAAGASAVAVISGLFPVIGEHSFDSYVGQVKRNTNAFLHTLNASNQTNDNER